MTLAQMAARIVTLRNARDMAHAAWCDRPPGTDSEEEALWTQYLDARRDYERALEEWFGVSREEIARLNETIERMVA